MRVSVFIAAAMAALAIAEPVAPSKFSFHLPESRSIRQPDHNV